MRHERRVHSPRHLPSGWKPVVLGKNSINFLRSLWLNLNGCSELPAWSYNPQCLLCHVLNLTFSLNWIWHQSLLAFFINMNPPLLLFLWVSCILVLTLRPEIPSLSLTCSVNVVRRAQAAVADCVFFEVRRFYQAEFALMHFAIKVISSPNA